ncbi:ribonuclease P protein subunit p21 isoform X1 [Drosophila nasuta]|uniref:ribonuclease P protein subunit p21 isoform X1 n=2 Tax=Drosophila nasuta TaxID=42062 RepID=UPI00295EBC8C|nr:ribonuclease P protein subunit p21 isoform X1 [Drosophila nasuta]
MSQNNNSNNNKCKRKILTQRHACSRMNFLYQAANLMAHSNNNTLAAYYGKLCRNVGTKTLMHMSPALKRTLCKRCSLPLLPGVNTTLQVDKKPEEETSLDEEKKKTPIKRSRRRKAKSKSVGTASIDEQTKLQLECSLCQAKRRFQLNTNNECWVESPAAIVQTITVSKQSPEERPEL